MNYIYDIIFEKQKSIILLFFSILLLGIFSYIFIPKESSPNIDFGFITVDIVNESISPIDGEKLIAKHVENELKTIDGIEEIKSTSKKGLVNFGVKLVFGTNVDTTLNKIQNAVQRAKDKFPSNTREAVIKEWSMASDSSVIDIIVTGDINYNSIYYSAKKLKEEYEKLPEVLSVDSYGDRNEEIEILVSQKDMLKNNISHSELINLFNNNSSMSPSGSMEMNGGNINFNIDGTVDSIEEIMNMPLKISQEKIILFSDIASISKRFVNPVNFGVFEDKKSIILSIKKRDGENILNTIQKIKHISNEAKPYLGENIEIKFLNDQSSSIKEMVSDLENNIITSVFLVFIVMLLALNIKTSILVGLAIPSSFFLGISIFYFLGISLNMIILFSLIMSVGLLVDGAIVICEYADKKIEEGYSEKESFKIASKKMFVPVFYSALTTIFAFAPLLFWPSTTGQFMYYLPFTLILMLVCSLVMSLVFIPILGSVLHKRKNIKNNNINIDGFFLTKYKYLLKLAIENPFKNISIILSFCLLSFILFAKFNSGTEFFPSVDSEYTTIEVYAKGDRSIYDKLNIVSSVNQEVQKYNKYFKYSSFRVFNGKNGLVGTISINLIDWKERKSSFEINDDIEKTLSAIAGIEYKVKSSQGGPSSVYDLEVSFSHSNRKILNEMVEEITNKLSSHSYLKDIDNEIYNDGSEINISIDRKKASKYGLSINQVSPYIQMLTSGLKISEFIMDGVDDSLDIRVKYNIEERTYTDFKNIKILSSYGEIPLSYIAKLSISDKTDILKKTDGKSTQLITGNVISGDNINDHIEDIKKIFNKAIKDKGGEWKFNGDQKEQKETMQFLVTAFFVSIFAITFVLLLQFNSWYQSFIVMISIFLSISGVLFLFLLLNASFGIVMGGLGIIALTGIVINNNIVLIDAFNENIQKLDIKEAVYKSAISRFRPVMLTTITTILGLLPMAFKLNINLIDGTIFHDAPTSQWWFQLAYTIIGGLVFSTILTLLVTPSLLSLRKKKTTKN